MTTIVTPDILAELYGARPDSVLYESPSGLFVGASHADDTSGEYKDIITNRELVTMVEEKPKGSLSHHRPTMRDFERVANALNKAAELNRPVRTNTHVAVIAGSQPPSMEVIANGPQELCEKQLEAWITNHPLDLFFEGQILKVESVIERKPLPPRQALSALLRQITGVKDSDVTDEHVTVITGALKKLEKIEAAWADDHLSKVAKIILDEE